MKTLIEILPDPLINDELGLFTIIRAQGDLLSWMSEEEAKYLDVEYLYSHSGEKTASPLLHKLIERGIVKDTVDSDDNEISWVDVLGNAAKMIYGRYAYNWNKIHEAYITEYKPLENYSMEESENRSLSHEGEDSGTSSRTDEGSASGKESGASGNTSTESDSSSSTEKASSSSTETDSSSSTEKGTDAKSGTSATKTSSKIVTQADNQNSLYGFNSEDASPSDASSGNSTVSGNADDNKVEVETSDSDSSEKTLSSSGEKDLTDSSEKTASSSGSKTITDSGTESSESSSSSKLETSEERSGKNSYDDDENRTLTRRGNIGVTTSQQMLESELELRKYDLIERMFSDCDKLLTLSVYR